jgi:hypothetical protein
MLSEPGENAIRVRFLPDKVTDFVLKTIERGEINSDASLANVEAPYETFCAQAS